MKIFDFFFRDLTIRFTDKHDFFSENARIWLSLSEGGVVITDSEKALPIDDMDLLSITKLSVKAKMRLGVPQSAGLDENEAYTKKVFSVICATKKSDFEKIKWSVTELHDALQDAKFSPAPGMRLYA